MSSKMGRNEPCLCGSGRKYKHCCGKAEAPAAVAQDSHEGAAARALAWLAQHHRKAFATALEELIDATVLGCLDDDPQVVAQALPGMDAELSDHLQINLTEWMLAEGEIKVKEDYQYVSELLLGPRGPLLSVGQRDWLAQLSQRPLRLYDVTDVTSGVGLTLCDALDTGQAPIVIAEREGSRSLRPGMVLGARVMAVNGGHQLSGAVYPFSMLAGHAAKEQLRVFAAHPGTHEEDNALGLGLGLIQGWLVQRLRPGPLPDFVHAGSGDPLLFTTDHYEVRDWDLLGAALAAQPDVQGDRSLGWNRLVDGDDGLTRSDVAVNPRQVGDRVSLFYKTASQADAGRDWFDALAGDAVKFLLREVSDPKGLLAHADPDVKPKAAPGLPDGLDPQVLADAIADVVKRSYANWVDEPIPALDHQTPRQAIRSASGLERVKGLLRSYEDGDQGVAAQQGRTAISYQFLWDALGLTR